MVTVRNRTRRVTESAVRNHPTTDSVARRACTCTQQVIIMSTLFYIFIDHIFTDRHLIEFLEVSPTRAHEAARVGCSAAWPWC